MNSYLLGFFAEEAVEGKHIADPRSGMSTYVIRSFLSLPFFNPPKAIFVPGMYFLGFCRYVNYMGRSVNWSVGECQGTMSTNQSVLFPFDTLCLVCIGVREALDLTSLTTE